MKLSVVHAGMFKLDGGAMFGIVPKTLWQRIHPPDANNLCTWAMRCLLIEEGSRKILIDTGMGSKQDAKFMSFFHPHGDQNLLDSLAQHGVAPGDITDVFITHLHFDHVGGAVSKDSDGRLYPTFPNALYWTSQTHYNWAFAPNPREKASFLKENFVPLKEYGQLAYIEEVQDIQWTSFIKVKFLYGHTEAMMIPVIDYHDTQLVFCADLLPSKFHVRMPYVMAYDVRPLKTLEERRKFYDEAISRDYVLFLEHDPETECIKLGRNERGRYTYTHPSDLVAI